MRINYGKNLGPKMLITTKNWGVSGIGLYIKNISLDSGKFQAVIIRIIAILMSTELKSLMIK